MDIFTGIMAVLGSGGFGSILGLASALWNRHIDLKAKALEYKDKDDQRRHDALILDKEIAGANLRATVVANAEIAVADAKALAASYTFAVPDKGSAMAQFSAFIRPFLTVGYFIITTIGTAWILYYAFYVANVKMTDVELTKLTYSVISWVSFQASAAIGFWFGNRASRV